MNPTIAGMVDRWIAALEDMGAHLYLDDNGKIRLRYKSPEVRKAALYGISMLRPHRNYVAAHLRCRARPEVQKMSELFGGTVSNVRGEWSIDADKTPTEVKKLMSEEKTTAELKAKPVLARRNTLEEIRRLVIGQATSLGMELDPSTVTTCAIIIVAAEADGDLAHRENQ